jgi:hypothetical protein
VIGLALVATLAAAAPATGHGERSCRERIETPDGPIGQVRPEPLWFGASSYLRHEPASAFRRGEHKAGLDVAAGKVVTLSVEQRSRSKVSLNYDQSQRPPHRRGGTRVSDGLRSVTFFACDENQRAFSYDGVVGPRTAYSGTIIAREPVCAYLRAQVRGEHRVWPVRLGLGKACPR